jgi:Uma2 family endonuclease
MVVGMRLSRAGYRRWVEDQPKGRFERVPGEPVAMAPERWIHAQIKARVWRAFDRELRRAGLPCEAAPDGMTVEIGEDTDYEPDALINCGEAMPDDAIAAPNPVVIVEVLAPGTRAVDTGGKLADYFKRNHPAKATGESRPELLSGVGDRRRRLAPVPGQQLV